MLSTFWSLAKAGEGGREGGARHTVHQVKQGQQGEHDTCTTQVLLAEARM
jgi:hypothetical protein